MALTSLAFNFLSLCDYAIEGLGFRVYGLPEARRSGRGAQQKQHPTYWLRGSWLSLTKKRLGFSIGALMIRTGDLEAPYYDYSIIKHNKAQDPILIIIKAFLGRL